MTASSNEELISPRAAKPLGENVFKRRSWDYAGTFATEILVLLAQVVLFKLAARWLGQTGFSEYALSRRVIALLQPLVMLGMGVGLTRHIALADGQSESTRSSRYLLAAVLCVSAFTAVASTALLVWRRLFSYVLFGSSEYQYLIPALIFMLAGLQLHGVLYAFLRGKLAVGRANALQLANNCLIPLIVLSVSHKDTATFLLSLGLFYTASSGLMLLMATLAGRWSSPVRETRELVSYGLQRVPGDFALMALLALPAIFAAHRAGIRNGGLVAFGLSIVNMVASVFAPVGIVLLPKVSQAFGAGNLVSVRREASMIGRLTLAFSSLIVVFVELVGRPLIRRYLGESYADANAIVNVAVIGAVPLAFYYTMRSIIDAFHHKAVNTANLLAALALFLFGSEVGKVFFGNTWGILWPFVGALSFLALLTRREIQRIFKAGWVRAVHFDSPSLLEERSVKVPSDAP